jgi:hypothetical protein
MTIADHRDHIVAQRLQLILQSDRDCFFVIRNQNTIRPSHRRNPSGHYQGNQDRIMQFEYRFLEISSATTAPGQNGSHRCEAADNHASIVQFATS